MSSTSEQHLSAQLVERADETAGTDLKHGDGPPGRLQRLYDAAERRTRETGADRGVVLLIADSEETLRKTHSHYFYTLEELLAQLPA